MKKLVIATLLVMVPASGLVSVAALRGFMRDRARADFHEHMFVGYALAAQVPADPQALETPPVVEVPQDQPPPIGAERGTPQRGGRAGVPPVPPVSQVPPVPPNGRVVIGPDGQTIVVQDDPSAGFDPELWARSRDAVRIGQDLTVGPNDVVRDAVVIFGNATVSGRVTGDLAVILGTAKVESTAIIDGDFVVIGGGATVQPGATARRDVVVIGGPFDAPAGFVAGGQQVVIGSNLLGGSLDALVPYLSRGLLWGRPIVPDLPWVWGVLTLFFLCYAALNLIFDRPVLACATTLRTRPLTAFGTGLLVLLLIGPICVLLAISIIGLAVVPFVICALIAAGVIGKVAVARWIGMSAVPEDPDGNRAHAARSFVIGFAVLSIAYMIPALGIIAWAIGGVLGLGSAALSFMAAYRRENPAKPPVMVQGPPPPPAPLAPPSYASAPPAADASALAFDGSAAAAPVTPPAFEAPASPPYSPPYAAYATAAVPQAAATGFLVAQPRALFRDRLAAFILDLILLAIVVSFLDSINVLDGDAFFPLLLVYMISAWTWKQTTVGGVICQLRLVRTDGAPLSFADGLVRGLSGIFSLAVLGIGALWILRDPEKQAWHDKIAGTYVVKVPRNWPL